jgi:FG-GAP-like repeat/FG-GAP repeat
MCRLWPSHLFLSCLVALALAEITACGHLGASGDATSALPPFNSYASCVVADFNSDGKLDIAVSYSRIAGAPPHPGTVAIYLQDPARAGSFPSPVNYSVGNDPVALVAGDLNGDGKLDLVAVNTILSAGGLGSSSVSVLLQDPANPGKFLSAVNYATGFSPVDVAIGDLNGDGRPDLAVADSTGISILLQSSTAPGRFLPLTTIALGSGGTSGIAIADVNGDGKADIVATSSDLMVFMQDPTSAGRFLTPAHYTVGAQPYAVAVQDLNSDGRPDIAVANLGSADGTVAASLSVLLQNPASLGNFLPATRYATGIRSWTIAAADLDGDGKPDLVVGNMGSFTGGSVSVFLQNPAGAGTFQPAVNYNDSGSVSWVGIGDMDGDGRQDLVIVSSGLEIRFQDPTKPGNFLQPVMIASP